jgi:hypothetical protein
MGSWVAEESSRFSEVSSEIGKGVYDYFNSHPRIHEC